MGSRPGRGSKSTAGSDRGAERPGGCARDGGCEACGRVRDLVIPCGNLWRSGQHTTILRIDGAIYALLLMPAALKLATICDVRRTVARRIAATELASYIDYS